MLSVLPLIELILGTSFLTFQLFQLENQVLSPHGYKSYKSNHPTKLTLEKKDWNEDNQSQKRKTQRFTSRFPISFPHRIFQVLAPFAPRPRHVRTCGRAGGAENAPENAHAETSNARGQEARWLRFPWQRWRSPGNIEDLFKRLTAPFMLQWFWSGLFWVPTNIEPLTRHAWSTRDCLKGFSVKKKTGSQVKPLKKYIVPLEVLSI